MKCRTCNELIEQERLDVLPNTVQCSSCAHKYNFIKPKKGIMVFSHKTGGELQTMSADFYSKNKQYFVPNGARSVMKNFSRNVCA